MSVPANAVQINGVSQVSGDNLNTYVQSCTNVSTLRGFIGLSNMEISLFGFVTAGDGGQGTFYYNANSTAADDGGVTTVVPNGVTIGAWIRLIGNIGFAPINSPAFTGIPTTPTAPENISSTQIANMAAVQQSMLGGFVNKFRNPGFLIQQRGASGTITAGSPAYSLDGWIISATGANVTWIYNGVYQLPSGVAPGSMTITGLASNTDVILKQRIESSIAASMSGVQTTFQMDIINNTPTTLIPTLTVKHAVSADNWTSPITDIASVPLQPVSSNATATLSYTFPANGNSFNGLEISVDFGALNSNTKNIITSAWDIRPTPGVVTGLNSSPPVPEIRPPHTELIYCQRYLPAFLANGNNQSTLGMLAETASTIFLAVIPFLAESRIAPTGLTISNGTHITDQHAGGSIVTSAVAFSTASQTSGTIQGTVASGLTAGFASYCYFNNANAFLLFTGAEL